jgi:hypothetical protein
VELPLLFDLISTLAVVFGILFGLVQLRQYRLSRKREAALYLLNSYRTKEFTEGIWIIQGLEEGLTRKEIEELLGGNVWSIGLVMSTWESIGILLFNHEVTIDMVDNAFSGPILFSWQKLERYVNDLRAELERETLFEWFQWLSDRIKVREIKKSPIPAHIAYKDWE